jgi:hypothetical protein
VFISLDSRGEEFHFYRGSPREEWKILELNRGCQGDEKVL